MNDNLKRLEGLIQSFVIDKNIRMFDIRAKQCLINGKNQCIMGQLKDMDMYLIAHNDLNIFENYLNLSSKTLQKVEQLRKFSFDIYEETNEDEHKRLKIKLFHNNTIEFSIMGLGVSGLVVSLTDNLLTVSLVNTYKKTSLDFMSFDDIDTALYMALDFLTAKLINQIGFEGNDPCSEDILKFINTTQEQLLADYFSDLPFNYIEPVQLINDSCNDLNYDIKSIKLTSDNAIIPYHMINVLTNVIKKIIPRKEDSYKMSQLISLMNFYYDLRNISPKNNDSTISFKSSKKAYLGLNSKLDDVYYSFHIGSKLSLYVGYQLKHHNDLYIPILDVNAPEHGTYYKFSSSINKKRSVDSYKTYESYTDDLDYVYNTVLNEIKSDINEKINNIDDNITSRHLDVYKMLMI